MYKLEKGKKYNRLTVISFHHKENKREYYLCKCDCCKEKIVNKTELVRGNVKSCGCLRKENCANRSHNLSNSRIYRTWTNMKARCYNKKDERYRLYGGRGIHICDEWKNSFLSFYNWAISNGYKDNLQIDRINNDGNYEPSNCRWADRKTQCRNKQKNIFLCYKGEKHCIAEWAEKLKIKSVTIRARLRKGYSIENILKDVKQGD